MKSHRSALLGLVLGASVLTAAACESKTEVIVPPDPVSVTVTPTSITLAVGQTQQLVAQVGGGDTTTPRTVTWASSNTAVATVDANGVVRGVAVGVATVTATSTADGTARAAASVTVTPVGGGGAPPTISIKSITSNVGGLNAPVNTQNVFGQIDVTLNVDVPQGSTVTRVETLIDGTVVCSQAFSSAAAIGTASNELGTDADVEIVCSVQTQAFNSATGAPTFPNGPHTLSARLVGPNGTIVATPSTQLIFNNTNFVNVSVSSTRTAAGANGPRSLMPAGTLWHGGDLTFTLLPVNYGPATGNVANFTVTLTSSGAGVTGAAGCTTNTTTTATNNAATDPTIAPIDNGTGVATFPNCGVTVASRQANATAGGPTTITFPASASLTANPAGVMNVEDVLTVTGVTSITGGGVAGPVCINPNPATNPQGPGCILLPNSLRLPVDNLAPRVTQLNILRPNQYYNGTFIPTHTTAGGAGCTAGTPCARTVDYGVDAQVATFQAGPAGSLTDVTAGFSSLPETQTSNTNVFALTIVDALTNSRQVFATNTNTIVANSATNAAVQLFGIDNTAPTQTVAGPPNNSTNCPAAPSNPSTCAGQNGWTISFSDAGVGPSGFNVNPVSVKLERILSTGTTCHHPDTGAAISCTTNNGFVADDGVVTLPSLPGYYRVTVYVTDAAGNQSTQTVIVTLRDYVAPTAGGIASPATITGGQSASFSSALADNVELGDLLPYTTFSNSGVSLAEARQTLGSYGPDAFTATSTGAVTIAKFVKSVETTNAGGLPTGNVWPATGFAYAVRDVAGVQLADMCPAVSDPDGATSQNCVLRRVDITAAVASSNTFDSFTNLTALNTANSLHGRFVQPNPSATTVCTKSSASCAPSPSSPTSTTLSATLTGPAGTFANQFDRVNFYYQDSQGRWIYIGTGTTQVTDNTVTSTRTYTYSFVWTPGSQGLLASQFAGGNVAVMAVGVASSGAALMSNTQTVTLDDA